MPIKFRRFASAVSVSALTWATAASAQPDPSEPGVQKDVELAMADPQSAQEIVVLGEIGYRNRTRSDRAGAGL